MATKYNYEKNGKKYFRITRVIGKKADGTPIRKEFYGDGEKDANEKADAFMNKLKNGMSIDFENVTINDLLHTYLWEFMYYSSDIKPSTFQRYEGVYRNYIKESDIASAKVHTFNSVKLQIFYNSLYDNKKKTSQIEFLNRFLKAFFNFAIDKGYIVKNPCKSIVIPGKKEEVLKKNEIEILSEKEIKTIQEYIKNKPFELIFTLALSTGARLGELVALKWENIDLKNNTISIEQAYKCVYEFNKDETKTLTAKIQTPKSKGSIRINPLPIKTVKLLKKYKGTGFVFRYENKVYQDKAVQDEWKKILKECKITHKKFHAIRHTYATLLLKNGVDIKTVQKLMGHSDIKTTQIYLHVLPDMKEDAVDKLNSIF